MNNMKLKKRIKEQLLDLAFGAYFGLGLYLIIMFGLGAL